MTHLNNWNSSFTKTLRRGRRRTRLLENLPVLNPWRSACVDLIYRWSRGYLGQLDEIVLKEWGIEDVLLRAYGRQGGSRVIRARTWKFRVIWMEQD